MTLFYVQVSKFRYVHGDRFETLPIAYDSVANTWQLIDTGTGTVLQYGTDQKDIGYCYAYGNRVLEAIDAKADPLALACPLDYPRYVNQ